MSGRSSTNKQSNAHCAPASSSFCSVLPRKIPRSKRDRRRSVRSGTRTERIKNERERQTEEGRKKEGQSERTRERERERYEEKVGKEKGEKERERVRGRRYLIFSSALCTSQKPVSGVHGRREQIAFSKGFSRKEDIKHIQVIERRERVCFRCDRRKKREKREKEKYIYRTLTKFFLHKNI